MKQAIPILFCLLFITVSSSAQAVPPPPVPIIETDIRDNTIKMRSIDLERVQRDSVKLSRTDKGLAPRVSFSEVKERFENIQKLQDRIIKAYTTEKKINYSRIRKSAEKMRKNAEELDEELFGGDRDNPVELKPIDPRSVRDLIIILDKAIGEFVSSPIFKNTKVVDKEDSKETQMVIKKVAQLSGMLSIQAEKEN